MTVALSILLALLVAIVADLCVAMAIGAELELWEHMVLCRALAVLGLLGCA